jgi:hypothetical protein
MDDDKLGKLKEALDKIKPAEFRFKEEEPDTKVDDIQTIDISGFGGVLGGLGYSGNITISSHGAAGIGASGSYLTAGGPSTGPIWTSSLSGISGMGNVITSHSTPSMQVKGDAEFDGDIKWKGRSLGSFLESIEDRLAILQEPDPKKLEKHAALKKAYDHYKLLEKLIGDE